MLCYSSSNPLTNSLTSRHCFGAKQKYITDKVPPITGLVFWASRINRLVRKVCRISNVDRGYGKRQKKVLVGGRWGVCRLNFRYDGYVKTGKAVNDCRNTPKGECGWTHGKSLRGEGEERMPVYSRNHKVLVCLEEPSQERGSERRGSIRSRQARGREGCWLWINEVRGDCFFEQRVICCGWICPTFLKSHIVSRESSQKL